MNESACSPANSQSAREFFFPWAAKLVPASQFANRCFNKGRFTPLGCTPCRDVSSVYPNALRIDLLSWSFPPIDIFADPRCLSTPPPSPAAFLKNLAFASQSSSVSHWSVHPPSFSKFHMIRTPVPSAPPRCLSRIGAEELPCFLYFSNGM